MAGIIAALVFGATSDGIEKLKTKRAERRGRRQLSDDPASPTSSEQSEEQSSETPQDAQSRGNSFAKSKEREASAERRRKIEEEQDQDQSEEEAVLLQTHPALRNSSLTSNMSQRRRADTAPPPPYVRDAPSYEEHYSHKLSNPQPIRTSWSSCG